MSSVIIFEKDIEKDIEKFGKKIMSSVIIFEKDIEKLGKKLMKEFYEHIHEAYFLKEFDEVKLKRKFYDENLTKEFLSFYKNREKNIKKIYFGDKIYEDLVKMKTEDLLKKIETKIKDETLDYKIIFNFLDEMDRKLEISKDADFEIYEDLFYMKKTFIYTYKVYHNYHHYLEH